MRRPTLALLAAVCALPVAAIRPWRADPTEQELRAFSFEHEVRVPVAPEAAFDAFTGDVSPWWDHTFSTDPVRFEIEPRAGGGFWEIFDEEGNGLLHARVTWAERGKKLVFRGPLGFHGRAVDMVHTFVFEADGGATRVRATVEAMGVFEESHPAIVEQVWHHFLGRYQEHVENGR